MNSDDHRLGGTSAGGFGVRVRHGNQNLVRRAAAAIAVRNPDERRNPLLNSNPAPVPVRDDQGGSRDSGRKPSGLGAVETETKSAVCPRAVDGPDQGGRPGAATSRKAGN